MNGASLPFVIKQTPAASPRDIEFHVDKATANTTALLALLTLNFHPYLMNRGLVARADVIGTPSVVMMKDYIYAGGRLIGEIAVP